MVKSPGLLMTCTGTVGGWNLSRVKVTVKPAPRGDGDRQGVRQPGPAEVVASAPDGIEFELKLHHLRRGFQEISQRKRCSSRRGDAPAR